jgi:heptaprenyl diphosphate synthase
MLVALAFVFSYVETLLPVNIGIPGAKLGLANLVVIVAIYTIGARDAFLLSMVRILLVACTFGNFYSFLYSLAGGTLSFLVMVLAKRLDFFSPRGVSVLGGIFHNVGQIFVAIVLLETSQLLYYLPVLVLAGTGSGIAIGLLSSMIIVRIKKYEKGEMT